MWSAGSPKQRSNTCSSSWTCVTLARLLLIPSAFRINSRILGLSWRRRRKEPARVGALTSTVTRFLDRLNSPDGTGQQFNHGPYLRVDEFLAEIQEGLKATSQRLAVLQPGLPDLKGTSPCLPNPLYRADNVVPVAPARRDLALPSVDLDTHWDPRSRGVTDITDPGWLFTGRAQLMQRLIRAATGAPYTLLVTGSAGSGKSAALARLVTLSDPSFAARYAERVEAISNDLQTRDRRSRRCRAGHWQDRCRNNGSDLPRPRGAASNQFDPEP